MDAGLLPIGGDGRCRVLMYHGIGEPGCNTVNGRHIGVDLFERQLRLFKDRFHVVPLDRLMAGERDPQRLTIALTFDDGLRNNLTHALPLLEKYHVPATFFITGANLAGLRCLWGDLLDLAEQVTDVPLLIAGERFVRTGGARYASEKDGTLLNHRIKQFGVLGPKRELYAQLGHLLDGPLKERAMFWQLMTDEELRRVAAHPLISIGSHGWWHNEMGRISREEIGDELRKSRAYLEGLTGGAVNLLAWPAGSYSSEARRQADDLGFSRQFAVDLIQPHEAHGLPAIMPRFGVYDFPVSDRYFLHLIAREAAR